MPATIDDVREAIGRLRAKGERPTNQNIRAILGYGSFEKLAPVFVWLLENGLKRDGRLLVIGGGVLQDIGCFIASVLFRGVRWEFIPTTLLAQCDSCIGSKSSINIESYKNQIGTFYAPDRVLLVTQALQTLPWDEVRSGLGEVIKLHLIAGDEPFCRIMKLLASVRIAASASGIINSVHNGGGG